MPETEQQRKEVIVRRICRDYVDSDRLMMIS